MNATLSGLDELPLFPSDEAREKALADFASSIKWWDMLMGAAICIAVGLGGMYIASLLVGTLARIAPWVLQPMVHQPLKFAIVVVCIFLTLRFLHRLGARRDLRGRLISLGVPVCMGCGYLLRGLPEQSAACPECGRAIGKNVRPMLRESDEGEPAND